MERNATYFKGQQLTLHTYPKIKLTNIGGPPYPQIHYLQFQLLAVGHSPKKIWKIKEINGS